MNLKIGQRVVHRNTQGRIRGTVEEIRIGRERTTVRVLVTFAGGRTTDYDYDAENVADEEEWDATQRSPHPIPGSSGGSPGGEK